MNKCSGGFYGGMGAGFGWFAWEIYVNLLNLGKMLKRNPLSLLMDLNPVTRNPGSAPEMVKVTLFICYFLITVFRLV